jgi:xanthine dehydrogenase accessory factor
VNEWIEELSDITAAGEAAVLVTISGIRGSTPRETGAKMIVTARETIGTIGGGQLEHQCTHIAAGLIGGKEIPTTRRFPLGPALRRRGASRWAQRLGSVVAVSSTFFSSRSPAACPGGSGIYGPFTASGSRRCW